MCLTPRQLPHAKAAGTMIDTIALLLGHALLVVALWRLALRVDVDDDPLLARLSGEAAAQRKAGREARRARRSARGDEVRPDGVSADGLAGD